MQDTQKPDKLSTKQKMALVVITIIDLMSFCSISLMSLFLPKEDAEKGAYLQIYDFSLKFSVFIKVMCALFFGVIVPKLGVKNMFLSAVVLSRISTTLFGTIRYVEDPSIYTFLSFLLRGIEAMGACAYFIAGYAIIFSTFPENVGIIRGFLETAAEIGTTIGPAIGDLFFTIGGYGLPFFCVGSSTIALGLVSYTVIDDIFDCSKNCPSIATFLKIPSVMITCAAVITISITTSSLDPTLGQHLTDLLPFERSGFIYLIISIAFALSSPIWSYLTEHVRRFQWMMPIGLYLTGISVIFLQPKFFDEYVTDSTWIKFVNICVLGVSMAITLVPTFRCLTLGALEKGFENTVTTHSYVISTWSFMFSLGEILGPSMGLTLYKNYSFGVVTCVISTINIVVGIICTVFLFLKMKHRNLCCNFNVTIYF